MQASKSKQVLNRAQDAPRYEFADLLQNNEELQRYATGSSKGGIRLDLSSRQATYALTRAILRHHFSLSLVLPPQQLIPTVPNRVQYLTWGAQLLGRNAQHEKRVVVDIGTGPSCIYALLGTRLFPNWAFIATDTDSLAIEWARRNLEANHLTTVKLLQTLPDGKLLPRDVVALKPSLTICNPPFHSELPDTRVPAGSESQLVTEGGEYFFLCRLADESTQVPSVDWFTSLVGRKVDLPRIIGYLRSPRIRALYVKSVELSQGGRTTRWAVAWSFGPKKSSINLVDDHGSKWRHIFSVRPGRQFANQLRPDDVAGTFSSALMQVQWREKPEEMALEDRCDIAFRGMEGSPWSQTVLLLHVTEAEASGQFLVHLKVRDRGEMLTMEFQELGNTLVEFVSDLLDGVRES